MSIDWNKPLRTKEHKWPVTFHKPLKNSDFMAVIVDREGMEWCETYTKCGHYFKTKVSSGCDLENVPEEKVIGVVNVYPGSIGKTLGDRATADVYANNDRTHVVTITECEGEVRATVEKVS